MTQRVARLEKAQPTVTAVLQDVASLKGTHEAVKGAIEQVQVAESEMARVREGQAGTKAWLASATESLNALRAELAAVEGADRGAAPAGRGPQQAALRDRCAGRPAGGADPRVAGSDGRRR